MQNVARALVGSYMVRLHMRTSGHHAVLPTPAMESSQVKPFLLGDEMFTPEIIRNCLDFDPCTGEFMHKTRMYKGSKKAGTINKRPHSDYAVLSIKIEGKYRKIYAHRAAWMYMHGAIPDGLVIDHLDGDGLNNRINNLRVVTMSINQRNRKNDLMQRKSPRGVYSHRGGFVVRFLGKHVMWTKDFLLACECRKTLEIKNGFIN